MQAHHSGLTQLGQPSRQPVSPDQATRERVANPAVGRLCPITGQPDFAHIVLDYIPDEWIIEGKSFKLFRHSYRDHGALHEARTMEISSRMMSLLDPMWLRIGAFWYPRRGVAIDILWQTAARPDGAWAPSQEVSHYRDRA